MQFDWSDEEFRRAVTRIWSTPGALEHLIASILADLPNDAERERFMQFLEDFIAKRETRH